MTLSLGDQEVLAKIFNQQNIFIFNEPEDTAIQSNTTNSYKNSKTKELESEAIKLAEEFNYSNSSNEIYLLKALELLEEASNVEPEHPSPYNNKGQILRLLGRDSEALLTLNHAIDLCNKSPFNTSHKKVLRLSSAQRGWLHFRADRTDEAFRDFKIAAKLGCSESRRMAVRCNPCAKLCNQIMHEIINSKFYSS